MRTLLAPAGLAIFSLAHADERLAERILAEPIESDTAPGVGERYF